MMAENSKVRSSFLANSSAGEEWLHSLTKTLKSIGKMVFNRSLEFIAGTECNLGRLYLNVFEWVTFL